MPVQPQPSTQQHYTHHYHQHQSQSAPISAPQFQIKVPTIQTHVVPQPKVAQQLHENYNSMEMNNNLANITNIMPTNTNPNTNTNINTNTNTNNNNSNGGEYSPYAVLSACEALVEDEVKRMRLSPEIIPRASQLFFKEVMKYRSFSPYIMRNIMQCVCESLEKENMYLPRANLVARAWHAEFPNLSNQSYIKAL